MKLYAVVVEIGWPDQYVASVWTRLDLAQQELEKHQASIRMGLAQTSIVEFETDTHDGLVDAIMAKFP